MSEPRWRVVTNEDVEADLRALDGSQRKEVLQSIKKVSMNPLPVSEGGYGKPLGNKNGINLTGCLKIKLLRLGIRVVYRLKRSEHDMQLIIVGVRNENTVYRTAAERLKDMQ